MLTREPGPGPVVFKTAGGSVTPAEQVVVSTSPRLGRAVRIHRKAGIGVPRTPPLDPRWPSGAHLDQLSQDVF